MSKDWVKDINEMQYKYGVHKWIHDNRNNPDALKRYLEFRVDFLKEELDETDVITFVSSMGFTTEDELGPDGEVVTPAGSFRPKKLEDRTPIHREVKTFRQHGADARKLTFAFPKRGEYEVICFATKQAGSQPDLETQRLQSIIRVGAVDPDEVWRTNPKVTELPEVLKEMRMPEHLSHIKRTTYPIEQEVSVDRSALRIRSEAQPVLRSR